MMDDATSPTDRIEQLLNKYKVCSVVTVMLILCGCTRHAITCPALSQTVATRQPLDLPLSSPLLRATSAHGMVLISN